MLHRTTSLTAAPSRDTGLSDHAEFVRRAHELRSAYIGELVARFAAAVRRTLRHDDRQTRVTWP